MSSDNYINRASVTCDRCNRKVHPWPLARSGGCSPDTWFYCIRNDAAIIDKIREETVKLA